MTGQKLDIALSVLTELKIIAYVYAQRPQPRQLRYEGGRAALGIALVKTGDHHMIDAKPGDARYFFLYGRQDLRTRKVMARRGIEGIDQTGHPQHPASPDGLTYDFLMAFVYTIKRANRDDGAG